MQRAVNPQTGEVLFLVNNQWVPPSQTARNPQTGQFAYLVNNEWQIAGGFKATPESEAKTQNPLMGFVARTAGLAGAALEVPDTFAQLVSNATGLPKDQVFELPIDTVGKFFADKALNYEKDIGYAPSTELKDLADNPLTAVPFIAERVITSVPDMAAAFAAAPAYFAARTNEILKARVENDKKTLAEATVADVSAAAGAAAFETAFERFATGRLLPGSKTAGKTAPGRIGKEAGIQSGTEFAEEFGTYSAETAGTRRGFDLEEAALAGLEGAIVGGGLGSTVQTAKEARDAYRRAQERAVEPEIQPPEGEPPDLFGEPPVEPPVGPTPPTPVAPPAAPTVAGSILETYTNPLDETSAEVVATSDNRFAVVLIDLTTGQRMDGGTFNSIEEADSVASQVTGVAPRRTAPAVSAVPPPTAPTAPPIKPQEFSEAEQNALTNYFAGDVPNAGTIFQNRDRSGKGSVAQMQKIAAAPDYSLVSPSKVLAEGAPVVISDVEISNKGLLGRTDTATASNGQRFPVQYAVLPANELTTSNFADGSINPNYGDVQTPNIRVVAGNGRVAGINEAYRRQTAEQYRNELINDPSHGVSPEAIATIPNPVLVRILPKSLVPANIGDLSNVSGIAGLEPVDRAKNDLKRLSGKFDITGLEFTEEGMPQLSTIKQFIQAMPDSEQSELVNKSTGLPTPEASSRLMNAIFYGAYENDALIDLYAATSNPDAKMYLNSLAKVAPKMVKLAGTGDYDVRSKVVEAIENMVSAVRQGVPIKEMPTFVQQGAIGLDPYAQRIMEFIADSGRSSKRIAEGLSRLADSAATASQVSQEPDLFGQILPRPSLDSVFESLREAETEPDLFGEPTPPKVTPPTPPKVEPPKELKFEIDKTPPEIYKEISKLDIPGLAQWAVDNAPNDFAKEIASKIQGRIKDFSSRNISMKGPVVLNDTSRVRGYRGKVTYKLTKDGFEFTYRLNGLVRGKEAYGHGLDYQTILHELVHAATVVQTAGLKKSDPRLQDLEKLRNEIRTKFRKDLAENKLDRTKQKETIDHIEYMLKNVDELMAVGLSDGEVQKYLKTVKVSKDFNAFGKLVDIARRVLGLAPNTQSALEALASTTDKMLSSPLEQLDKDLRESGRFKVARKSPVEDDEIVTINLRETQEDLFGEDAKTLSELDQELPKAKKKLPPGRSPELAAMAELLKEGKITKQEFDAAVNKYRPIPLYDAPLEPATNKQVVDALSSDKKPDANIDIPSGTKVGLRLDIPAWNNHKTFVVSIHEGRPKITSASPGKVIGYRSVAVAKNVTFGLGNQRKALDIAAGGAKDALQTMEGEYVNVSPEDAFEMAKKAFKDGKYVQLGFDPTRHSYFYDRKTTLPVVKADVVLQIGNMILAKNVQYGEKFSESFLYNIDDSQADLFSEKETEALKKTDDAVPGAKIVTKNRSPELTAAAQQLSRGEITKEEYEAAVQRFSPVSVYAEPPKPASNAQVESALDANKKKYANVNLESGTRVGLRLDIPAWENRKTWVVAIHKPKAKVTSPKALENLSYRSVAALKNVVFGIGDQSKTLNIAAGAFKDKLQTMEGEYVNISPEEAYRRAQELIKDPSYIQVGFNPTRHAYFYDRRTMLPVISAEEVLQIGNFILAKDVTYGKKDDFLFDIDSTPEMTEKQLDTDESKIREDQIAEYAMLRAKRERLLKKIIDGGATVDIQRELTNITELAKELKDDIDASYVSSKSPQVFLKRALEAFDKGDISAEVLATIQEAYNKTPFILNGIRLSIKTPKKEGREIGNFNPFARIVTLWNGTKGVKKPETIRHELMHSLEQMMTPAQRKVVIEAWERDFIKAAKKNKDPQSRLFFKKASEFIANPSQESFSAATAAMPSFEFYQYLNPSEYWAVNAETLMASKLGTAWDRFVKAIRKLFDALKNVFGFNNRYAVHKTFDQLMSDKPKRMSLNTLTDFVVKTGARPVTLANISKNVFGQPMPEASWGKPDDSKIDDVIYTLQDKMIDTKRVVQNIKKSGKAIADKWNPYLQEELYHGRTATRTKDFLTDELEPMMKEMADRGLTMAEVEEYLHNRHAKSRNEFNAKRDKNMPDGGSGIFTADAQAYLDGLDPKKKRNLEAIAKRVDQIVAGTQKIIVATGQESQETIDAWNKALQNYVPLQREETDYDVKNVGIGVGSGFAVKGPFSRAAVGSSKNVIDILANVAMQRERAIVRGEKMRVAKALYGLVASNPNPGFWLAFDPEAIKNPQDAVNELVAMGLNPADAENLVDQPVIRKVDPATNTVVERPNSLLVNSRTSMPVRINGKEKYIIFNAKDPRAERMAEALKNLDADQLGKALNYVQQVTQYFAKINTQYNPIFGVINFLRDVQGALLQLSTTPLKDNKKEVLAGVTGALRGIYTEERLRRKGQPPSKDSWAQLWEEFQQEGGQTGFRDQFSRSQERAEALQAILDPSSWTKTPLGKVFTAGGTLKVPLETARKVAAPVFDWLSDYNQTMENAVRLSAYKVALDKKDAQGKPLFTKQQAASIAKNLTVNFNRKGQIGRQAGALYAFFNAAVQGTARMLETLRGPAGQKIIYGGLLLGSAQAMMLAALGFDEDEPPEFVKERNIIIPISGSKYITIPMPLGYNVIPNTSRILTEWTLSGFKDTHKRVADITGAALDMFNPLGNAGWSVQTLAPTVVDPLVALAENKDWTGKPIAKEDISNLDPTPGYTRSKETASYISKAMAKFLNAATGGSNYTPGVVSPTPDQIDYLIGQLTGGVGRELLKAEQTVTSQFTGEDLPIYKVPLVGRFVGDSEGQAAERNRFYNNIILLNKHERELKGRLKDRVPTKDYLMEYPEARLYSYANQVERNIQTLRKQRDALIEKGAPKERVKRIENQMAIQMKRFNDRVKQVQE